MVNEKRTDKDARPGSGEVRAARRAGALTGLLIGDALAMPVHWYYDRAALARDYDHVTDFLAPKHPHPDSILWRSTYNAPNARGEILHDQKGFWGRRGVHYHQNLAAGENTLTGKLARLVMEILDRDGGYDADVFLAEYRDFMTTPGRHRDTYVEECHRGFFTRYARGSELRDCGIPEKHIGGLVSMIPIVVHHAADPVAARKLALEHVALTHRGPRMEGAADLVIRVLLDALAGRPLADSVHANTANRLKAWIGQPDETVVGRLLSPACYVEDAVPATLYLAAKYEGDPEGGLVANTNLGGDNVHRGAVLGALLGAANGLDGLPTRWRDGLSEPVPVSAGTR